MSGCRQSCPASHRYPRKRSSLFCWTRPPGTGEWENQGGFNSSHGEIVLRDNTVYLHLYSFYTPVFRQDVLWYGAVRPSGC